jgi:hypothetical protein
VRHPPAPSAYVSCATTCTARPKAAPGDRAGDTHDRVRTDRVDADGKLTLRVNGKLHHIGIGRTLARTPVLMLVRDLHIRVINAATGELLRELILDTSRDYQPTGRPRCERHTAPSATTGDLRKASSEAPLQQGWERFRKDHPEDDLPNSSQLIKEECHG